jgi:hypothetical protein
VLQISFVFINGLVNNSVFLNNLYDDPFVYNEQYIQKEFGVKKSVTQPSTTSINKVNKTDHRLVNNYFNNKIISNEESITKDLLFEKYSLFKKTEYKISYRHIICPCRYKKSILNKKMFVVK